jgi:hypothetical protein
MTPIMWDGIARPGHADPALQPGIGLYRLRPGVI